MEGHRPTLSSQWHWIGILTAWLIGAALMGLAGPARAASFYSEIPGCTETALPSDDPRYPAAQFIAMCVPTADARVPWNGTLIVFVHGYVEPQEPLVPPVPGSDAFGTLEKLLDLGFAFATSSFHKNGYAVEQGGNDINALARHFHDTVGPARVLLVGGSEGALITTMLIERHPERYAGGLALCGPLAGANMVLDYLADFRVVFDYLFPQVFNVGVLNVPPLAYLSWPDYEQLIRVAIAADPQRAEQLFRVTGVARDPDDPTSTVETAVRLLRYNVFGVNDVLDVAAGNPSSNESRVYAGSDDDAGLNAGVARIVPDPDARAYLDAYYQPTGHLQRPLVTLHTRSDSIVPVEHELRYRQRVAAAGAQTRHRGFVVDRYGHCNFTTAEALGALAILVDQTDVPLSAGLRAYRHTFTPRLSR